MAPYTRKNQAQDDPRRGKPLDYVVTFRLVSARQKISLLAELEVSF